MAKSRSEAGFSICSIDRSETDQETQIPQKIQSQIRHGHARPNRTSRATLPTVFLRGISCNIVPVLFSKTARAHTYPYLTATPTPAATPAPATTPTTAVAPAISSVSAAAVLWLVQLLLLDQLDNLIRDS
ncbi:hypothetical protein NUU61_010196 [Penicillium alfredii]|uniref:Uncharacterized protein n=1 Tax=Penicillium alfredii TaxID=1506179 RepID=A0A9W9JUT3_9EURO|nr:uncharacterized protein NUU61_010196 [Penicillium alfredii]KAJ5081932.1 hypothetical protein NUU61_010196 [Penicillium alfredii]